MLACILARKIGWRRGGRAKEEEKEMKKVKMCGCWNDGELMGWIFCGSEKKEGPWEEEKGIDIKEAVSVVLIGSEMETPVDGEKRMVRDWVM